MRGHEADGLRVAVAGGSLAGLMAATALRTTGCEVDVYERTQHEMTSRGAGIVVQPSLTALLAQIGAPALPVTGCTGRNYLPPDGGPGDLRIMPQRFTSWEAIYRTLLSAFPPERYHLGSEVTGFDHGGSGTPVTVRISGGGTPQVDLFVSADGWRSTARHRLLPQAAPQYAGYIAWRGILDERSTPDAVVNFFEDNFTFSNARSGGHALCYLIPGHEARTAPGQRRLNWVWYVHAPEGSTLDAILTDQRGNRRDGSVPPREVADAVATSMREAASRELHPRFAELILATPEPFIQVILDMAVPKMLFGRVCLLGDAAFIVRPHTAGATAKAADDARALALATQSGRAGMEEALTRWEVGQLRAGREMYNYGVALGRRLASAR